MPEEKDFLTGSLPTEELLLLWSWIKSDGGYKMRDLLETVKEQVSSLRLNLCLDQNLCLGVTVSKIFQRA
jgi:hypothetical protein